MTVSPGAQRIIDACKAAFPANSGDCSAFVRAVGSRVGVELQGNADSIVGHIETNWTPLTNIDDVLAAVDRGDLVVAGMRGADQEQPSAHGHVVVVVSGPLAHGKYPTAYWGRLHGTGEQAKTLNFAWRKGDRDRISYGCTPLGA